MESGLVLKVASRVANSLIKAAGGAPIYAAPGHFYSPIANLRDVSDLVGRRARNGTNEASLPHIDYESMTRFFGRLAEHFPTIKNFLGARPHSRYREAVQFYDLGDAYILSAFIMTFCPKRFIEIGSGFSSACALDTAEELDLKTRFTFIDPYPTRLKSLMTPSDFDRCEVIERGVQSVALDMFEQLERNDILLIDSSHILKTGSDVHYELFEILPRIKPGVIVHFHDIFCDWEYPDLWITENNRSWNEIYALRAFLMFNDQFEILYFNQDFWHRKPDLVKATLLGEQSNPGSGLYIRRKDIAAAQP